MKIILNNANIEFRAEKPWKSFQFTWNDANTNTGVITSVAEQGQYSRPGVGGVFISVDDDGKSVDLNLVAQSEMFVYVYNSEKTFLGYGRLGTGDFPASTIFNDIISAMPSFKIGTTEQNRASVIASAKYYKIVFGVAIGIVGNTLKVR